MKGPRLTRYSRKSNLIYLYGTKFSVNNVDHSFNLLGRDWPGSALLSQQVHDVSCELRARLFVLLQLGVVDGADLRQLGFVVRVLDGGLLAGDGGRGVERR